MHEMYAVLGVGSEVRKLTSKNQLLQIQEEHTSCVDMNTYPVQTQVYHSINAQGSR